MNVKIVDVSSAGRKDISKIWELQVEESDASAFHDSKKVNKMYRQ